MSIPFNVCLFNIVSDIFSQKHTCKRRKIIYVCITYIKLYAPRFFISFQIIFFKIPFYCICRTLTAVYKRNVISEIFAYRLTKQDFFGWVLEDRKQDEWGPVYSFTEEPNAPIDYVTASFWCEHAPESIFNKGAMVSLRTDTGRRTIDGDEARVFDGDGVTVYPLASWEEKKKVLREWFGIVLPE